MSDGLIGPNAILQLLPILDRRFGKACTDAILCSANVHRIPQESGMIPEGDAARLHHHLRLVAKTEAGELAAQAGTATADYIMAHRIPGLAQAILKILPSFLAAKVLSRAIAAHAWTFVGSGEFRVVSPWVFEISNNPLIRGESAHAPLCHWHAAVFTRLYQRLVSPRYTCRETQCGAQPDSQICRFEFQRI